MFTIAFAIFAASIAVGAGIYNTVEVTKLSKEGNTLRTTYSAICKVSQP